MCGDPVGVWEGEVGAVGGSCLISFRKDPGAELDVAVALVEVVGTAGVLVSRCGGCGLAKP